MKTISVRVPKSLTTKQAKACLVSALNVKLAPFTQQNLSEEDRKLAKEETAAWLRGKAAPSKATTSRETISVSPAQASALESLFQLLGDSPHLGLTELASVLIEDCGQSSEANLKDSTPTQLQSPAVAGKDTYKAEDFLAQIVRQHQLSPRSSQIQIAQTVETCVDTNDGNGVIMVEAPTGSGKTLAYVCAVMAMAANQVAHRVKQGLSQEADFDKTPRCHAIAVPSMVLMRQVESEIGVFMTHCADMIDPKVLPYIQPVYVRGKAQFVSEERLMTYLSDPEITPDQIGLGMDWIEQQKENSNDPSAWHMESLARVLPEAVTAAACDASTSENDRGLMRYRSFLAQAKTANVVVASHMMLCIDSRLKNTIRKHSMRTLEIDISFAAYQAEIQAIKAGERGEGVELPKNYSWWVDEMLFATVEVGTAVFPPIRCLVVDEAHQLQSAMVSACSNSLSLYSFMRDSTFTEAKRKELKPLFEAFQQIGRESQGSDGRLSLNDHPRCLKLLQSVHDIAKKVKGKRHSDNYIYGMRTIENALFMCKIEGYVCELDFSPIVKHPRLVVGPKRVDGHMGGLWGCTQASTCLSATFFLPKEGEMFSSDSYMRILMAIPPRMVRKSVCIKPEAWLTDPVVLHVPDLSEFSQVPRSNIETEEDSKPWLDAVHRYLTKQVYPSAQGGVLVLGTSYEMANGLYDRLCADPLYTEHFKLVSKRNVPLDTLKNSFEEAHYEGKRCIWIAVGQNAWTGMDLRDRKVIPAKDNMLTDLVVPRLPFAAGNNPVMREMAERMGQWISVSAMLLLLKQGLGRLIRSQGVQSNRRIFLIDPRIHTKTYGGSVKTLIKSYRKD